MKKGIVSVLSAFLVIAFTYAGVTGYNIRQLFRMNAQLKNEGYYSGEFEFKMLGLIYYLDNGKFITAMNEMFKLKNQMKSPDKLVKIPDFNNDTEKLNFFISLQEENGAFMDPAYPYFTYFAPTLNMVDMLQQIADKEQVSLNLNYPLSFPDAINTPEKLTDYLNSMKSTNCFLAKIKAPYVAAISELAYYSILKENNLYDFSSEWETALKQWFIDNQDDAGGFWGVDMRCIFGSKTDKDMGSTYHILSLFLDEDGNLIDPDLEPKYNHRLFISLKEKLERQAPLQNISKLHDWSLTRSQGVDVLSRVWQYGTEQEQAASKKIINGLVNNRFDLFYDRSAGAFSLYPNGPADLDGTGTALHLLDKAGMTNANRQKLIFTEETALFKVLSSVDALFAYQKENINSVRLWHNDEVVYIYYPEAPEIPDVVELKKGIMEFLDSENQEYGNWVSKEQIIRQLSSIPSYIRNIQISYQFNDSILNELLNRYGDVSIGSFDKYNIPLGEINYFQRGI